MLKETEDGLVLELGGEEYPHHPQTGEPWTEQSAAEYLASLVPPEPVDPPELPHEPVRVSKARFGDLLTTAEHRKMNIIRWQITQLTLADRLDEANPLPDVEVLFQKFDLPSEFIELDNAQTIQGVAVLGMLGVFGADAEARVDAILSNTLPG